MSSNEEIQDTTVLRTLIILTGSLFGFFLLMIFLARSIVY